MRTIKIGKSQDNDCCFSNPNVSRHHALINIQDNGAASVRDLGSTNGTFVNGRRITQETPITAADKLSFGNEQTNLQALMQMLNKTRISIPQSGAGGNRRTIGRAADCNIKMPGADVSSHHAIIYRDAGGNVVIEDTNSSNGTFVNGRRVTSQVLKPGDKVTITRNYPLDWQSIMGVPATAPTQMAPQAAPVQPMPMPPAPAPQPKSSNGKLWIAIAAVALVAVGLGVFFMMSGDGETTPPVQPTTALNDSTKPAAAASSGAAMTLEQINNDYSSAVFLVVGAYDYKVMVDDKDITSMVLAPHKPVGYSGTAFFITQDGKLATNLHIAKPWLFSPQEGEKIAAAAREKLAVMGKSDPRYNAYISQVKVEGVLAYLYVLPNGLPLSQSNLVECSVYRAGDDTHKDVAVIQTQSRSLPPQVKKIIDINNADDSDKAYTVGAKVYTIGYPLGVTLAENSNQEMINQAHEGHITQSRGEYEFGHDAATTSGASGSPVISEQGRLIGVHNAGVSGTQGFNIGIKVKYVKELLN